MTKIKQYLKKFVRKIDQKIYKNRNFVIVSNNCWGAEIYKQLNKEYNTPFVGLFIYGPDYLRLLQNFKLYTNYPLKFTDQSKWTSADLNYPIGLLDDVEVHFMHYNSKEEAYAKWSRRLARMNAVADYNKYFFKICDKDFTNAKILAAFHELPFKNKISFGVDNLLMERHYKIEERENNKTVPDGLKLFKVSHKYLDVLNWINTRSFKQNNYSRFKFFLKLT